MKTGYADNLNFQLLFPSLESIFFNKTKVAVWVWRKSTVITYFA